MDRRDACLVGGGRVRRKQATANPDLALVGRIEAGHQLDQRRLARAVLANQRIDLAGPHLERNVVEREYAWKGLRQAVGGQHDVVRQASCHPLDLRDHLPVHEFFFRFRAAATGLSPG